MRYIGAERICWQGQAGKILDAEARRMVLVVTLGWAENIDALFSVNVKRVFSKPSQGVDDLCTAATLR